MDGGALLERQRGRTCDVLAAVPPTAPSLCDAWDAHDVAIHLWMLSHDPIAWPGQACAALAPVTHRRAAKVRSQWSYEVLIDQLRSGSAGFPCMPFDSREDHRHALGEWWMHAQDVARPNGVPQEPRDSPQEDALWLRVQAAAHSLRRRLPAGLVLALPDGRRCEVSRGPATLVVTGDPGELMCWVYGRRSVAVVEVTHT